MGRFLTDIDYAFLIQNEDIFQILGERNDVTWDTLPQSKKNILYDAERTAAEEISSYLRGRYNMNQVFVDVRDFSLTNVYFGNDIILFNADDYLSATTYTQGQTMAYNYNVYECVVSASTTGLTPDLNQFSFIAENNSYFYANLPFPQYDPKVNYYAGQKIWYENKIYVAQQNVKGKNPHYSQNLELRYGVPGVYMWYGEMDNLPINSEFWALNTGEIIPGISGSTYQFSGESITNTTFFTAGDARNPQIKMYLIDIILYHLHARINPRNTPKIREIRYGAGMVPEIGAIGWLKNVQKGKVNLNIPEIIPSQGGAIRWGSYPKDSNRY